MPKLHMVGARGGDSPAYAFALFRWQPRRLAFRGDCGCLRGDGDWCGRLGGGSGGPFDVK